MTPDAADWLTFVIATVGYFLAREGYALARRQDQRFTLSTYIKQLEMAMGRTGGRTVAGVILTTLFIYLMGHLVAWWW